MSEQVSPERISRAVRAYFLAIRAMDADAFANTFAEDGTTYDPIGLGRHHRPRGPSRILHFNLQELQKRGTDRRVDFRSRQRRGRKVER